MALTIGRYCSQITGRPFDETLHRALAWPPDLFGLLSSVLGRSGAYRRVVSPPPEQTWPPDNTTLDAYRDEISLAAEAWSNWIEARLKAGVKLSDLAVTPATADELAFPGVKILEMADRVAKIQVDHLGHDRYFPEVSAIIKLLAIADQASAGCGMPGTLHNRVALQARWSYQLNLTRNRSLSRLPVEHVCVLPKTRTAQCGITMRSLSHHLAAIRGEVGARWQTRTLPDGDAMELDLLLFPWPLVTSPDEFCASGRTDVRMEPDEHRFFDYVPTYTSNELYERFQSTLTMALQKGRVDGVVLPECAVTSKEFKELCTVAQRVGIHFVLGGVRGARSNNAKLWTVDSAVVQPKHHRWSLTKSQIEGYRLDSVLDPRKRWWESMDVGARALYFTSLTPWLSMCHLVCEDLARVDPVSEVIRAVGPNLLVALLMDGPQLMKRWPGRCATIFADDPGCSVLTLTSLGMARLSRPGNSQPKSVIALWRDANQTVEVRLPPTTTAAVLRLRVNTVEEFTADGRSDGTQAGQLLLVGKPTYF